jgi:glycerophosphoryl diester phosphodiesterase
MSCERPLLLGHRGARAVLEVPENTFASFELALRHGVDGFEFDVRRTGDEFAVICHDPRSGGCEIARSTRDSLGELPLLEEVVTRYGRRAFLDIELKVGGLEETLVAFLKQHSPLTGYVVSSFLSKVVLGIRALDEKVPLGLICDTYADFDHWRHLPISHVMPHYRLLTKGKVAEIQSAGVKVFTWTVNQRDDMLRLRDWGVDAIISDDTDLLVRTLRPA